MTAVIKLFDRVALARDLPDEDLRRGDVAVVVERITGVDGEAGYVLEVFNALGETVKVVDVPASAVVSLSANDLPAVRPLAPVV